MTEDNENACQPGPTAPPAEWDMRRNRERAMDMALHHVVHSNNPNIPINEVIEAAGKIAAFMWGAST